MLSHIKLGARNGRGNVLFASESIVWCLSHLYLYMGKLDEVKELLKMFQIYCLV